MNNTFQLPLHQPPNTFIYIVGRTDMKCNTKLRNTRIHAIRNGGEIANMQAGHASSRVRLNPFLEGSSTGQFPWTSYHLPRVVNTLWGWFSLSSLFPLPTGTWTPWLLRGQLGQVLHSGLMFRAAISISVTAPQLHFPEKRALINKSQLKAQLLREWFFSLLQQVTSSWGLVLSRE